MKIWKIIFILVISLGLLWFSENFPIYHYFEPQSTGWTLWMSYAKDLLQPFALYIFICLGEKWLKTWLSRALVALAVPTLLEFGQIFYRIMVYRDQLIYMGSFDLFDILAYAIGVALAVLLERKVLAKYPGFWG